MSMNWKKLSDEKPTEEGVYLLYGDECQYFPPIICYGLNDFNVNRLNAKYTHWLLIEPPKGGKK